MKTIDFQIAPNMADPISIKDSVSSLKKHKAIVQHMGSYLAFSMTIKQLVVFNLLSFNGSQLAKMKKSIPDMSLP